jgi:hypothetical protein
MRCWKKMDIGGGWAGKEEGFPVGTLLAIVIN